MVPPSAMPLVPGRTDSAVVGQQGLVSAADPRAADAGAQITVVPPDIAHLPARPCALGHVAQEHACLAIRQVPGAEQVDSGARQRRRLLVRDDGKVGARDDRLDRGELHGDLLWHQDSHYVPKGNDNSLPG
jgi:hypothetical protein